MKKNINKSIIIPIMSALLICIAAWWYLFVHQADMLHMAHLRSLFIGGWQYFSECTSRPGGLLLWTAQWFMQLLYTPAVGISVITAIWIATFFLLKKAFRLSNEMSPLALLPLVCLLASDISIGYWVHYTPQAAIIFRETLGVLILSALINIPDIHRGKFSGGIIATIITTLAYPFIGYYAVVGATTVVMRDISRKNYISAGIGAVFTPVAVSLIRMSYSTISSTQTFTIGLPIFSTSEYVNPVMTYPYYAIITILLLLPWLSKINLPMKKFSLPVLYIAITAASIVYLNGKNYTDVSFHAECRAFKALEERDWDGVLKAALSAKENATRELVIFKNIALINKGTIGNEMYQYPDKTILPKPSDSLNVELFAIAGPQIYLHHGMSNFSYRWAMELSVMYGLNYSLLKSMAQAAMVMGDYGAAEKYLSLLSRTMHYKEWAAHYMKMLKNPQTIAKSEEFKRICELNRHLPDALSSDEGLVEKYVIDYYSCLNNYTSPDMCIVSMPYALASKDIKRFWRRFFAYVKCLKSKEMPIHYQEAAYLYGILEPQTQSINNMPFDKERIVERYKAFNSVTQQYVRSGMSEEAIGEATKAEFGDTFWWSYYFDRNSKFY